jgi:hypothetical protein
VTVKKGDEQSPSHLHIYTSMSATEALRTETFSSSTEETLMLQANPQNRSESRPQCSADTDLDAAGEQQSPAVAELGVCTLYWTAKASFQDSRRSNDPCFHI